jgi:spermidine/putrescine transport system substrate-binding protein
MTGHDRKGEGNTMGTRRTLLGIGVAVALAAVGVGCGSGGGDDQVATAPASPDTPATGTLRIFSYEDSVTPEILADFRKQNPGLKLQIATFDSNQEAAAKLRAGFRADVVNTCLDEMNPLKKGKLLRPVQTKGITAWNDLSPVFRNAKNVADGPGKALVVPNSAGPQGIIYNTKAYPQGITSFADLFSPALKGKVTMDGSNALTPLAEAALIQGSKDPMNLSDADVKKAADYLKQHGSQLRTYADSDTDLLNLYKSGEVVASDGGQGSAHDLVDEGVPVKYVKPKEGQLSWVCGLSLTSHAQNTAAAYRLMNYYLTPKSQAQQAEGGFVIANPKAMPLVAEKYRETADPAALTGAYPEAQPDNYQTWSRAWTDVKAGS